MSANLQPPGRIGVNERWEWALDGVLLEERKKLELMIGGHWVLGVLLKCKDGHMIWSSWLDAVSVPVAFFIQARWPKTE